MNDREQAEQTIDGIIQHARAIERFVQKGDGEYRLRNMLKVYDWAVRQQPFKVGDRVKIFDGPFARGHGYEPYNQVFLARPAGEITEVHYNGAHLYWAYLVRLDELPTKLFGFSARSIRHEQELTMEET